MTGLPAELLQAKLAILEAALISKAGCEAAVAILFAKIISHDIKVVVLVARSYRKRVSRYAWVNKWNKMKD